MIAEGILGRLCALLVLDEDVCGGKGGHRVQEGKDGKEQGETEARNKDEYVGSERNSAQVSETGTETKKNKKSRLRNIES